MSQIILYVHIGATLPSYLADSIFQVLYISNKQNFKNLEIAVVLSDPLVEELSSHIKNFNPIFVDNNTFSKINIIKSSELTYDNNEQDPIEKYLSKFKQEFRDNFWNSTTTRFFYIERAFKKFYKESKYLVHLESDIMIYDLQFLTELKESNRLYHSGSVYMVKDNENRVIPSIVIYEDYLAACNLARHIIEFVDCAQQFYNDMYILSKFYNLKMLDFDPRQLSKDHTTKYIFDGAAIGQYLCGIDPRNIEIKKDINGIELPKEYIDKIMDLKVYNNPQVKFINETFDLMKYFDIVRDKNGHGYILKNKEQKEQEEENERKEENNQKEYKIVNLHIHSKQLWQVSSINNIKYADIISGDQILEKCDTVFTTPQIKDFHKGLGEYKNICVVLPIRFTKEHETIILNELNNCAAKISSENRPLRIFIYTHILDQFSEILKRINYTNEHGINIYVHNSDHTASKLAIKNLESLQSVKKVYCQNAPYNGSKFNALPIGQANRMWKHGQTLTMYKAMEKTYKNKRNGNIYININTNTYKKREEILNVLKESNKESSSNWTISETGLEYEQYLSELGNHYFSLCPRGNGIDTHRFWESLYLGTIPVVVVDTNNEYEVNYYKSLEDLGIPFYKIMNVEEIKKYNSEFFNCVLYASYVNKYGPIQCLDQLKINHYFE